MTLSAGTVYLDVKPNMDGFTSGVQSSLTGLSSKMKAVGRTLSATVTLPIIGAFTGFISAAQESQKVAKQTEAVIKSTGGSAKVTAKEVTNLANAISRKTGIDDEAIQSGENLLLTFTNIHNEVGKGNDIFNQATEVLVDMSAALGTDASGSAIQLGKALNDPVAGISALTRVGVTFTEQQKKQIAQMVKAGDTAEAQKVILAELQKEFGGSAEAIATPFDKAKVAVGNMAESLGKVLLPIVNKVSRFVSDLAEKFGSLSKGTRQVIVVALGLAAALGPILLIGSKLLLLFNPWVLAIAAVAAGAYLMWQNWDKVQPVLEQVVTVATDLWDSLQPLRDIVIEVAKIVWDGLVQAWEALVEVWDSSLKPALSDLWEALQRLWDPLLKNIVIVIGAFYAAWLIVASKALPWVIKGLGLIIKTAAELIRWAAIIIDNVATPIAGALSDIWASFKWAWEHIGKPVWNTISGFIKGMARTLGDIFEGITDAFIGIWNGIGDVLVGVINPVLSIIESFVNLFIKGVNWVRTKFGMDELGPVELNIGGGGGGSGDGPRRARGTPGWQQGRGEWKGGMAVVGEEGPELVFLPKDSTVIPNKASSVIASMLAEGTPSSLVKSGRVPGFAGGLLGSAWDFIKNIPSDAWGLLMKGTDWLVDHALSAVGVEAPDLSRISDWVQSGGNVLATMKDWFLDWVEEHNPLSGLSTDIGGGLVAGIDPRQSPNAAIATMVARAAWPNVSFNPGIMVRGINFASGPPWSQHSYGNALDQSPPSQALADWWRAMAPTLHVGETIYNRRDSWAGGAWTPYGGSNPHTDHVHTDFIPYGTGTPPPGGGWPFAYGGLVTRPTSALIGEAGPEAVIPLKSTQTIRGQLVISDWRRGLAELDGEIDWNDWSGR